MFRCHFCGEVTPPGTKRQNVVIATREKSYPSRRDEAKRAGGRFRPRREPTSDAGGKGVETMKEVPACPTCAAKHVEVTTVPIEGQASRVASEHEASSS